MCIRDSPYPAEHQRVVARDARRLVRQPGAVQRRVEEVPRAVAGEDAARPVSPVCGRRKPEDGQPRPRVPPPRHRSRPVAPVAEGTALDPADLFSPAHEAWAGDARRDAPVSYTHLTL